MSDPTQLLAVYLHLAETSRQRQRPHVSDRLLVLAGVEAANQSQGSIAACCREMVLVHNPHHLIGRWATIPEALLDDEFLCLLRQLRRRYPQEKAERLLAVLEISVEHERKHYATESEYLAALVDANAAAVGWRFPGQA
jgi:Mg-chelatase subunit ChlI